MMRRYRFWCNDEPIIIRASQFHVALKRLANVLHKRGITPFKAGHLKIEIDKNDQKVIPDPTKPPKPKYVPPRPTWLWKKKEEQP